MKVDIYTKVVLTVIAVCLTILTLNNLNVFPKAFAAPAVSGAGSVPVNMDGSVNVKIVGIPYNGIPVELKNIDREMTPVPVEIQSVPYNGIPVEVRKLPGSTVPVEIKSTPYGGVPVKVENSYIYVKQY